MENERIHVKMTPKGPQVEKIVTQDTTLNKYMLRIYKTTGVSIASSLLTGYYFATMSTAVFFHPFLMVFGGLFMSLAGISTFRSISPNIVRTEINGQEIEKWVNPVSRQLAFSAIVLGTGISLSPLLAVLNDPSMIFIAAGLSITMMGGASLYAMKKPLGQFKSWEANLAGGLVGIIGMNLMSILAFSLIGPNVFSHACTKIDLYLGIALFSALQAYDTQHAIEAYKHGQYDHLSQVLKFFLNFSNFFVRILQALSRGGNNNQ